VANGRLGLYLDEVVVVLHVEDRLGRVDHPPDHHSSNLDRVAHGVVDLEGVGVEVLDPHRDRRRFVNG
jgi:hypothetical protein